MGDNGEDGGPRDSPPGDALARLRTSLQVLAARAQDQVTYFPDFVCTADEMALDYDHWLTLALHDGSLSGEQATLLTAIDDYLGGLGGLLNGEFWTDDALDHDPRWGHVRTLAQAALAAMGWPLEMPPSSPDMYVPAMPDSEPGNLNAERV